MEVIEQRPQLTQRENVERLEGYLARFPQVHCEVQNHFAPGVYLRTMIVPAGAIATGAVHKTEHLTIIAGHCLLTTDEGPREFIGYETFLSKPGAKRAIVAIETTVVTTVHPTDETDLDKLCELLTESKSTELIGGPANKQLLASATEVLA